MVNKEKSGSNPRIEFVLGGNTTFMQPEYVGITVFAFDQFGEPLDGGELGDKRNSVQKTDDAYEYHN